MILLSLACVALPAPRGEVVTTTMVSASLDTEYEVHVYITPEAAELDEVPWLLVLDGDWFYDEPRISDLAVREGRAGPHALVGIASGDTRDRDYTPPLDPPEEGTGGLYDYMEWIEGELVPAVEAEHGIGGRPELRGLHGHSFGGLATMSVFFDQGGFWGRYGATSPSVYWGEGDLLEHEAELAASGAPVSGRLYTSMGELENVPMNVLFDEMVERVERRDHPDLAFRSSVLEGENHFTAWQPAFEELVPFLFPPS